MHVVTHCFSALAFACALTPQASAQHARELALRTPDGRVWLDRVDFGVVLAGGQQRLSSAADFTLERTATSDGEVVRARSERGALALELHRRVLGPRAVVLKLTVSNRGRAPLGLHELVLLEGRRPAAGPLGQLLPNPRTSWGFQEPVRLHAGQRDLQSWWTVAVTAPRLVAGFLTCQRSLGRFTIACGRRELHLRAWASLDGRPLAPGESLSSDELFLSAEPDPRAELERFADLAAAANHARLWPHNFATWCSWYSGWIRQGMYAYKQGLEKGVLTNIPLVAERFAGRRGAWMRIVDDSDDMPYGDWDDVTKAVPGGFSSLVAAMRSRGVHPGFWLPLFMVTEKTRLFREHPGWLARDRGGAIHRERFYGNSCGVLDCSKPEVLAHLEAVGAQLRRRGMDYVMTDFLLRGVGPERYADPRQTRGELHRRGLEAFRRGLGREVYWLGCGALLGPSMGLVDGMRISGDSFGDKPYSYLEAGYRWFYHRRLWLNDPDAIVCRGKPVAWNRAWMSWMALAGVVLTYGDTFDDLEPDQAALYERIFPPLDVAGRPLDLLENDPYLLWGVALGEGSRRSKLFGLFFFDEPAGRRVRLNLDSVSARIDSYRRDPTDAAAGYLLWDFWGQELLSCRGPEIELPLPARGGRLFALREELGRPQLLGTSGHFSQGWLEVPELRWDASELTLSGAVLGNGGDATTLFFHLPRGFEIAGASLGAKAVQLARRAPAVAALDVPALSTALPFAIRFRGAGQAAPRRPFHPAPPARVLDPGGQWISELRSAPRLAIAPLPEPRGYRLLAALNCGVQSEAGAPGGARLHLKRGAPFTWKPAQRIAPASLATVAFDEEAVVCELLGLDPSRSYQLGFTWWDFDGNGRVQSATLLAGDEESLLLDRVPLPAWRGDRHGPARHLFHLPAVLVRGGSAQLRITPEVAGTNAVLCAVHLWEKR